MSYLLRTFETRTQAETWARDAIGQIHALAGEPVYSLTVEYATPDKPFRCGGVMRVVTFYTRPQVDGEPTDPQRIQGVYVSFRHDDNGLLRLRALTTWFTEHP